jgi:phosphoglycolate phosphatase-like HAD superfamily hydrolase
MSSSRALILFDIDGTLLRGAGGHHKQALIDGIRQVTGLETHLNGVATSGMLDRDLISAMLGAAGHSDEQTQDALHEIAAACQSAYLANCAPDLSSAVCPGVRELLDELRKRGAVVGLVTGNLSAIGWKKMELAGLREYFSVGAFAEDGTTRALLAGIAWQRAINQGLIDSDAPVGLIGDHMNDVEAAKANGFTAIAVASGLTSAEALAESEPDILVHSLNELFLEERLDLLVLGVA